METSRCYNAGREPENHFSIGEIAVANGVDLESGESKLCQLKYDMFGTIKKCGQQHNALQSLGD